MATLRGMIMPDVIGSFNQGREVGEGQRTKRTLSQFMQPAIGGNQQALSEIYRADPQAGYRVQQAATQEQEQALGREDKRKERLGQMARQLIALPEAMRPAAYRQLIPELSTFGLETVPPDYTPEVDDVVRQVAEALAPQSASETPSAIRELQMLKDNPELRKIDTERRQAGWRPTLFDADGGKASFDPRTGTASSVNYAGAPQRNAGPGSLDISADLRQFAALNIPVSSTRRTPDRNKEVGGVGNSYHLTGEAVDMVPRTPQERQQARTFWEGKGYQVIDEGDHLHVEPPRRGITANPLSGARVQAPTKSPSVPSGYRDNGRGGLEPIPGGPAQIALEARAAAAAAKKEAAELKAAAAKQAGDARQNAAAESAGALISSIDSLTSHAGFNSLGTEWGDVQLKVPVLRNDAKDASASLKTIAGQIALTTMADLRRLSSQGATGFGALSAPELKLLENSITALQAEDISNEQLKKNLKIVRDKMDRIRGWNPQQSAPPTQPSRPTSESEYNALPSGALFIDPDDGKTYRKP